MSQVADSDLVKPLTREMTETRWRPGSEDVVALWSPFCFLTSRVDVILSNVVLIRRNEFVISKYPVLPGCENDFLQVLDQCIRSFWFFFQPYGDKQTQREGLQNFTILNAKEVEFPAKP